MKMSRRPGVLRNLWRVLTLRCSLAPNMLYESLSYLGFICEFVMMWRCGQAQWPHKRLTKYARTRFLNLSTDDISLSHGAVLLSWKRFNSIFYLCQLNTDSSPPVVTVTSITIHCQREKLPLAENHWLKKWERKHPSRYSVRRDCAILYIFSAWRRAYTSSINMVEKEN